MYICCQIALSNRRCFSRGARDWDDAVGRSAGFAWAESRVRHRRVDGGAEKLHVPQHTRVHAALTDGSADHLILLDLCVDTYLRARQADILAGVPGRPPHPRVSFGDA